MNRFLIVITLFAFAALARDGAAQSVTLYTAGPDGLAKGIAKAFTDKTAIKVDVYQATSGDVLARLEAEKAKPRADVIVLASWGEGLTVRQRGLVDAYSSPEAKKLRPLWSDGGLAAQGGAALALIVNSNEVKKDQQPQSWFDLATPFWKDSLTMPDPTLSGSAAEFIAVFVQTHGDKAWKLFEDLARNGEKLAIYYPKEGTVVALRPAFVQQGAPHREEARKLIDFMLSEEGQILVAKTFLIPARSDIRAQRPAPGEFKMLAPDWPFVEKNQTQLLERFRKQIVEQIIQKH